LLLGHLYRVKPAPPDVEGEAPELAQCVADAIEQPGVVSYQVLRSVIAASLLVAQDEK
jgi:hypothetical protein